jgi:NCAIR mutase (PurE)-related protein
MNDRSSIVALLERLLRGDLDAAGAADLLASNGRSYVAVGDFARVDVLRAGRTGIPEIVHAPGKTPEQIRDIVRALGERGARNVVVSRLDADVFSHVSAEIPGAAYHPRARVAVFHPEDKAGVGCVGVVAAGTADLAVAEEVDVVCRALGSATLRVVDAGVAGLDRSVDAARLVADCNAVVCVAGMEASLPSVLGGLLAVPVIAVPASGGYGVNAGGFNALFSALGSCVPGVVVVNIDNGVGAAAAAHRINLLAVRGSAVPAGGVAAARAESDPGA